MPNLTVATLLPVEVNAALPGGLPAGGAGTSISTSDGTPSGVVTANPGSIDLDTTTPALYVKQTGVGNTGWVEKTGPAGAAGATGTAGPALPSFTSGSGSPEGVVTAAVNSWYENTAAPAIYIKQTGSGNTGWAIWPAATGDPFFANVSLLLSMDDAAFLDTSSHAFTDGVTGVTQDMVIKKFGVSSANPGAFGNTRLAFADNAAFDLTTGDWTIEGWVYSSPVGNVSSLINKISASNSAWPYHIAVDGVGVITAVGFDGGNNQIFNLSGGALTDNTWYHFALVRHNDDFTLYIGGTSTATVNSPAATLKTTTDDLEICGDSVHSKPFWGRVDEVRITKGVARYTTNFTPPTSAFPTHA